MIPGSQSLAFSIIVIICINIANDKCVTRLEDKLQLKNGNVYFKETVSE